MAKSDDGLKESKPLPLGTLAFLGIFVAGVCLAVGMFNTKIEPIRFKMPPSPTLPTDRIIAIPSTEEFAKGKVKGPAFFAFGEKSYIAESGEELTKSVVYTTLADGSVVEIDLETQEVEEVVFTGNPKRLAPSWSCGEYYTEGVCGRPTGIAFDQDALKLYVLDSYEGLLLVDRMEKKKELLVDEIVKNDKLSHLNDVVVSRHTGRVYFVETSIRHQRRDYDRAFYEVASSGRLLMFNPEDGVVEVLSKILVCPTGITLVEDPTGKFDEFLVITETPRARLRKYLLPTKKGTEGQLLRSAWIPSLPILPRSLQWDQEKGALYVSGRERRGWEDSLSQYPELRKVLMIFPKIILDFISPAEMMVLKMDRKGKVLAAMRNQDKRPEMRLATHFQVVGKYMYVGSDNKNVEHISKIKLPRIML